MRLRTQQATPELEAFYQEAMLALVPIAQKHGVKTIHVICALARALGYAVASCFPDERDLARQTAILNMDEATEATAQNPGHTAVGLRRPM